MEENLKDCFYCEYSHIPEDCTPCKQCLESKILRNFELKEEFQNKTLKD